MRKVIIGIVIVAILAIVAYVVYSRVLPSVTAARVTPEAMAEELEPVKASNEVVADAVVVPVQYAELTLPTGGIVDEVPVVVRRGLPGPVGLLGLPEERDGLGDGVLDRLV